VIVCGDIPHDRRWNLEAADPRNDLTPERDMRRSGIRRPALASPRHRTREYGAQRKQPDHERLFSENISDARTLTAPATSQ
jgi:hypothetical protein